MKTKAIVIPQANVVEMREVDLKPIGTDDVLIRTTLTSISAGTERMLLKGVMPHPMLQFPVVPGYETVGEVIETGDGAREWLGKRVYVGGNYGFIGVNPAFGGQSEYIVAPKTHLTDLQTLTDEQGVLLALAATALHGVDVAGLQVGRLEGSELANITNLPTFQLVNVLILGQGIVGQLAARIAQARGTHVTVTDKEAARLRCSLAHVILNMSSADAIPETLKDIDILIDATGKMEAIAPMLMRMKRGGRVVLLGYYDCINLPYQPVFLRELTLVSSMQWAPGDVAPRLLTSSAPRGSPTRPSPSRLGFRSGRALQAPTARPSAR
ncbi:MAG: zinc-binding dehydrogenase [Anaerolineae bacterium]|nr:zinc-binding dehydrogenase [Anaerolineae bacterium]